MQSAEVPFTLLHYEVQAQLAKDVSIRLLLEELRGKVGYAGPYDVSPLPVQSNVMPPRSLRRNVPNKDFGYSLLFSSPNGLQDLAHLTMQLVLVPPSPAQRTGML